MSHGSNIRIKLAGNFRLEADGVEIRITGARHRALLAILAASDQQKKTRDYLKATLWPRSDEAQAAGSLRATLAALRRDLGDVGDFLRADRTYVWLEDMVDSVEMPVGGMEFFEDAPTTIGSHFDDWLQTERAGRRQLTSNLSGMVPEVVRQLSIGIVPVRSQVDDPHCALLASRILDYVAEGLRAYDVVDLYDFRHSEPADRDGGIATIPDPKMLVELQVIKVGTMAQMSVSVYAAPSRQLLWNRSLAADQAGPFLFTPQEAIDFANHTVDAILIACFRNQELRNDQRSNSPASMIGVLHRLLGMSRAGQRQVRNYLSTRADLQGSAMSSACYALSIVNTMGEDAVRSADIEEAEEHAIRARALDPQNPIVLALVGHVYGFGLREFTLGAEMLTLARKSAPNLAICWDFSAMNAVYREDVETALKYSQIASRLGQFSPYRPLFQSSLAITSTLSGDHETAVRVSQSVLSRMPDFLAVMRHCSASLSSLGRHDDALRMIGRVREIDQGFGPEGILDPTYPLPSTVSREAIGQTFRVLGLNR
ncbi:hypothetical protein [Pseudoruegeria sp. HB172150]|uniref:hypothetical protein n=1 Tax=Pseudoruegeria sp. HB172150 TaxID=2721164 RepID=UPI001552E7A9|nr:hypothetical protein [Pseudoruegeria sp. HB172150]